MSRAGGRTASCGRREAQSRLRDAQAHLDLAELAGPGAAPAERKAAISAAVLAGIAAADAACCTVLGKLSRSSDHRDATRLVDQIADGGSEAGRRLARLLDVKHASQYGVEDLGGEQLVAAVRQATALVEWAERVVRR
jgi:hypothetical protein